MAHFVTIIPGQLTEGWVLGDLVVEQADFIVGHLKRRTLRELQPKNAECP